MDYNIKSKNVWLEGIYALKAGQSIIIPTDTLYGVVASALNRKAVSKLYKIRGRNPKKPCIVLCSSFSDLLKLKIKLDFKTKHVLERIWPNPVSVILPCPYKSMSYLHRGSKTLAIRIPRSKSLRDFIKETGPIVAPSANPEGKPPAKNLKEAKNYFGNKISTYIYGKLKDRPSTLVSFIDGEFKVIREGAWKIPKNFLSSVK